MQKLIAVCAFLLFAMASGLAKAESVSALGHEGKEKFDLIKHVVKKGECVWCIAKNFNVAIGAILKVNPVVAKRPNAPHLLSAGETITIPRPQPTKITVSNSAVAAPAISGNTAVLSGTIGVKESAQARASSPEPTTAQVAEADRILKGKKKSAFFLGAIALLSVFCVGGCVSFGIPGMYRLVQNLSSSKKGKSQENETRNALSPQAIIAVLGSIRAVDLAKAMEMEITTDERRKSISLRDVVSSIMQHDKHQWPKGILVRDLGPSLRFNASICDL